MSDVEDNHVNDNSGGDDPTVDNQNRDQIKCLTDLLLQSPSALEVLGRGLLPTLSPLMSQHTQASSSTRPAQVSSPHRPNHGVSNVHAMPPFCQPWYAPYPFYGPPSYGQPPHAGPLPFNGWNLQWSSGPV